MRTTTTKDAKKKGHSAILRSYQIEFRRASRPLPVLRTFRISPTSTRRIFCRRCCRRCDAAKHKADRQKNSALKKLCGKDLLFLESQVCPKTGVLKRPTPFRLVNFGVVIFARRAHRPMMNFYSGGVME
jgi:hypothetical protein